MPLFITLLFGLVGEHGTTGSIRPVLGGALLAVSLSAVFGVAVAIGNERRLGTLAMWLTAPVSLVGNLAGKAIVHLVDGLVGALNTLVVGVVVFDVRLHGGDVPALALVFATVVTSSGGYGLVVGAATVRYRDTFAAPTVAMHALMLLTGSPRSRGGAAPAPARCLTSSRLRTPSVPPWTSSAVRRCACRRRSARRPSLASDGSSPGCCCSGGCAGRRPATADSTTPVGDPLRPPWWAAVA